MKINPLHTVTIIMRSAHERTEELCKQLIHAQGLPENQVFTVHEVPFSAAMKKSFEIGLKEKRKWTYCIDADVLLRPNSIEKMLQYAEKERANVCEIQGFVLDKYFGGLRQAGNHLYRTSLLDKVMDQIPEEGVDIRPERYTLGKMAKMGYPWKKVRYIVGLHDEEQYFRDIYRKAFIHGVKHLDRAELLVNHWKKNAESDEDFKLALTAFSHGIEYSSNVYIDTSKDIYTRKFMDLGVTEKSELTANAMSSDEIERRIIEWDYPSLYHYYFPTRDGYDSRILGMLNKLKRNYRKLGLFNLIKLIWKKVF